MIGVDTNIILRIVLEDDGAQVKKIKSYIQKSKESLYISIPVLCEFVWTLKSSYKYSKSDIVEVIIYLLQSEEFVVEDKRIVAEAANVYLNSVAGFSDALIGLRNKAADCKKTITLDEDAAKLKEFELL